MIRFRGYILYRLAKLSSDSHAHILEYGATQQLPLEDTETIQGMSSPILPDQSLWPVDIDAVGRVRDYILSTPDIYNDTSKFITGGGWDHTKWPSASWPTAVRWFALGHFNRSLTIPQAELDADPIIRGRPVVLQSKDCHALWVSSKAIETSFPLPEVVEGGVILRDNTSHPIGELYPFIWINILTYWFQASFWIMLRS